MPGFLGLIKSDICEILEGRDVETYSLFPLLEEKKCFKSAWIKRFVLNKFIGDKIFHEDESVFICTDGVILNAVELRDKYLASNNFDLLKRMYASCGPLFVGELRGDFSGVIYDKVKDEWDIFTNHIGSKPIFYFYDEENGFLMFGSNLKMMVNGMRYLGYDPKLCEIGSYCLLTFGFMLGDYTLIEGIKKLSPGSILKYSGESMEIIQYYKLSNTQYIDDPKEKILAQLDEKFKKAIKAEYDKDLEYGYRHVATLSGGMDSRMNVCYSRKLGYKNILNVTFSQSNYRDEQIAKKISSEWGCDFLFYSLDNGNYLKDIEKPVIANDGLILFAGSAHDLAMLSLMDWQTLGGLHTGMLGDAILGTYLDEPRHSSKIDIRSLGAYSTKLYGRVSHVVEEVFREFPNSELFKFYNRGVNGVFNGYRVYENFTEFFSPFMHIDFLEYTMKIDPQYRFKEKIYLDWIKTYSPEAVKYPWARTGLRIDAFMYRPRAFANRVMRYARRKILGPSTKDSMNPFNYWYKTNRGLREAFETYFQENLNLLNGHSQLQEDTELLFADGSPLEKTQALTLIAALKLHKLKN